jgi:hypothetical protein
LTWPAGIAWELPGDLDMDFFIKSIFKVGDRTMEEEGGVI